jgi:hypothetical protein
MLIDFSASAIAQARCKGTKDLQKPVAFIVDLLVPLSECAVTRKLLTSFNGLKPGVAREVAEAAMNACREAGHQVPVVVVDRPAVPQVMLRDRLAGRAYAGGGLPQGVDARELQGGHRINCGGKAARR